MTTKTITQREAHQVFKTRQPISARYWTPQTSPKGRKGYATNLAALVANLPGFTCALKGNKVLAEEKATGMRVEIELGASRPS